MLKQYAVWSYLPQLNHRFELTHQLIFECDSYTGTVTVLDLKTRKQLFDVGENTHALALDNGFIAGHSQHIHLAAADWPFYRVTTYLVGREQLTRTRQLFLMLPHSDLFTSTAMSLVVSNQKIFIVQAGYPYIAQYRADVSDSSKAVRPSRIIDTLECPQSLGLLPNGRLVFSTPQNVYSVV